jgi:F-type H+-transporting ATPase subunit b
MPQLDVSSFLPQFFWLVLSFGTLYFILSRYCIPKLSSILHERERSISKALATAEKNKSEAAKLKEDYEEIVRMAMQTRESMLSETTREINKMVDHKLAEHELELKIIENNTLEKIQEFQKKSAAQIKEIAKEATAEILENLIDVKLDPQIISKEVELHARGKHGI